MVLCAAAFLRLRGVKKPGTPGVMEGKGGSTGPRNIWIVRAQGYISITTRQELGNNASFQAGVLRGLASFVRWTRCSQVVQGPRRNGSGVASTAF
jgi:hypothetical protein